MRLEKSNASSKSITPSIFSMGWWSGKEKKEAYKIWENGSNGHAAYVIVIQLSEWRGRHLWILWLEREKIRRRVLVQGGKRKSKTENNWNDVVTWNFMLATFFLCYFTWNPNVQSFNQSKVTSPWRVLQNLILASKTMALQAIEPTPNSKPNRRVRLRVPKTS